MQSEAQTFAMAASIKENQAVLGSDKKVHAWETTGGQ